MGQNLLFNAANSIKLGKKTKKFIMTINSSIIDLFRDYSIEERMNIEDMSMKSQNNNNQRLINQSKWIKSRAD